MTDRSPWGKLLGLALILAVLCNGASVFLKRTGLVDGPSYLAYWAVHCATLEGGVASEHQCSRYTTPEAIARAPVSVASDSAYRYVYETSGWERGLKVVKDAYWLLLIGSAFAAVVPREEPLLRRHWSPVHVMAACCFISFAVSVFVNGPLLALTGLRSFLFLLAALAGRRLAPRLPAIASALVAILVLQVLLAPWEMFRGIHLFHGSSPEALASRVMGTLSQPNSMGVFAASALAFHYCFAASRVWLAVVGIAAWALALLSGSATGIVCVALVTAWILRQDSRSGNRTVAWVAGTLLVGAVALTLPQLSGREDVLDSILSDGGRLAGLHHALADRGPLETAFGSGLGVNTNLALSLAGTGNGLGNDQTSMKPTDSSLTGLIIQIGVLGAALFYAMLVWAAVRDCRTRLFYFVAGISSLTINLTELFPVNVLLGIALAHSASQAARRPGQVFPS